jgi:hypothetical protein
MVKEDILYFINDLISARVIIFIIYISRSLYRPRVQDSKDGNVQMSARVCVAREATVPQGAS